MATKINWCDETINPIVGCTKISDGCRDCYAEPMARRLAAMGRAGYGDVINDGKWNGETAFIPSALEHPGHWRKPRSIFVGSMGDLFHESVRMEWIEQIIGMVAGLPHHTFIFLTKRPDRMKECLDKLDHGFFSALYQLQAGTAVDAHNWPLPNLALGVSAENQKTADERIRVLLQTPAIKRFVSIEPMLGQIDLVRGGWSFLHKLTPPPGNKGGWKRGLDGVILGGESGNKARYLTPQWVRIIRDQCQEAGVPFMFKQGSAVNGNKNSHWVEKRDGFPVLDMETHTALPWSVR